MSRKVSHRRKPKAIPKQERLRDVNLFPKKERELFEKVPQHFLGISDQQLGRLFENAWALIEIHEGAEAVRGFRLLCHLHPYVSDFWYGLAHALKESGNYEEALDAFIMAETMEPTRFEYYQEAIGSALEAGQKTIARRIFQRLLAHKRSIDNIDEYKAEIKHLDEATS
jgi:tetratricopeptide (TPR) repeat protein